MTDRADPDPEPHPRTPDGPLWAAGAMTLRVVGLGQEPDRLVRPPRPFAVVGRAPGADVRVDDPAAAPRHVYLHLDLDRRGVYAVDLVTRTGTRFNGVPRPAGWLRPGDRIEVAGRGVELARLPPEGSAAEPPPSASAGADDLLADHPGPGLPGVTLEPLDGRDPPWVLGSELVFLGSSASCGVRVPDPAVVRVHGAVVRSRAGAYLVNLLGRDVRLGGLEVADAAPLADGARLTLGSTPYLVHVRPPAETAPDRLPVPVPLIPAEARSALLAWSSGGFEGAVEGEGEGGSGRDLARRQEEFQAAVVQALRQIQRDNADLLNAHLRRIDSIDRELAALRSELERRQGPQNPPPPDVPPLRIARPEPTAEPRGSTAWLLDRVGRLEAENRSAWSDLLGRLKK